MSSSPWILAFLGILERELLRFFLQRERFFAALVRPLVWLFIFAAGFRSVLGVSIQPPYETYVLYEVYIVPGLCGMILLFSGMQGSLSMVYDRETGEVSYGRIPPGSVVVSGNLPSKDGSYSLYCAVIVKKVDAKTRAKTSINDLLRGD